MARGSTGCAARLAMYTGLAVFSLVVGALIGAALVHFDQDLALASWLAEQGVPLPPALYGG
ncbi:MAG: hypothetical protein EP330_21170 [Deltaproteobacteria bacterium]|nr:MAG: hypothetical protein EP330_21170 [Deltaproteobacteria bacterium]